MNLANEVERLKAQVAQIIGREIDAKKRADPKMKDVILPPLDIRPPIPPPFPPPPPMQEWPRERVISERNDDLGDMGKLPMTKGEENAYLVSINWTGPKGPRGNGA